MSEHGLAHPLTVSRDEDDRRRLRMLFPDLAKTTTIRCLALRPYLDRCPERFFDRAVHASMLGWLLDSDASNRPELRSYLAEHAPELSRALLFLRQQNTSDWHDQVLNRADEYELVSFIDMVLHPAYLRLVEGVFAAMIHPVAYFSRLQRGKPTDDLDVFNSVEEIRMGPMAACVKAYNHVVRNGIGHGGVTYLQGDIRYGGKKGKTEVVDVTSVVRLCDDMIDTCNALASAIKVFLIISSEHDYLLPHELLVEELVEETASPWWSIGGCIQSEIPGSTQLIIYARPESRDVLRTQWACVQSAALAEHLAPGYGRYFLSLRGKRGLPGWAAFDGTALKRLRESGATEPYEYASALVAPGIVYKPHFALPGLLSKLDTFAHSFRLQWPLLRSQVRTSFGIPVIVARHATMHRNGWRTVLNGEVVLPEVDSTTAAGVIRTSRRRIVRSAARLARSSLSPLNISRYLPLGFARLGVLDEDFRRRRLSSFGLGSELICTIQLQKIRRIRVPDIMGSTIESRGAWRIAWNRSWIDSGGETAL